MKKQVLYFFSRLILLAVIFTFISCTSFGPTKPNVSMVDKVEKGHVSEYHQSCFRLLHDLAQYNHLLAHELGKIPEFQDGISIEETSALEGIVALYGKTPDTFDSAFKQMYQVGIPEVRKYCSPLQALFWLCKDKKYDSMEEIIKNYNLENLLRVSWQMRLIDSSSFQISDEEAIEIVRNHIVETDIGPMKQSRKKPYLSTLEEYLKTKDVKSKKVIIENIKNKIHLDYKINKNRFSRKGRKIIKKYIDDKLPLRWKDFNAVVGRLNSPKLLHYYIQHSFRYKRGDFPAPYVTFKRQYGNCTAVADFGAYVLKRNGYDTFVRSVKFGPNPRRHWHTGAGAILEDGKYLLVIDFGPRTNFMSGPYKDVSDLDLKINRGDRIIGRMWGHPPGPWF